MAAVISQPKDIMNIYLKRLVAFLTAALLVATTRPVAASSTILLNTPAQLETSDAAFRGTVVGVECFQDEAGLIYTKTSLRVAETFKGTLPAIVLVVHRGGQVGSVGEVCGLSPQLVPGGEYLMFVNRESTGRLHCTQGAASAIRLNPAPANDSAAACAQALLDEVRGLAAETPDTGSDVTDQIGHTSMLKDATTGMLSGVNSRFLQPDRGETIPVLIDAASLPTGITLAQATNAVLQALTAWSNVTSLKFSIESIAGFGQGADTITNSDGKLRIQLHDNYGRINTANTLGIGGRAYVTLTSPAGWNLGGSVAGNEFARSSYGYVVLEAGNASMQNAATFAEVLCHEIGHALNMAHSSENPSESNTTLKQAIMYYQAHADGRGAALGAYDPPIIQQCYPANTVPYTFSRVIDATTAPTTPNVAGINEVELRGYDLQSAALTIATNGGTTINGTFALSGNTVRFTPGGYYGDSGRYDPDTTGSYSYYGLIYARFSDGTNASPYALVRVVSLRGEATSPPDGIPDYWMNFYFGHPTPQAGDASRAGDDADGDKLTNLQEYLAGMNPVTSASQQLITNAALGSLSFQAKAYDLYEIMASTNLVNWTLVKPFLPTNASLAIRTTLPQASIIATVSNLPTSNPYLFYRVRKVP